MANNMDIQVKVGLTADLFVWMRDASDEAGLSHSAFLRFLLAEERRRRALNALSAEVASGAIPGVTPTWAKDLSLSSDKS